MAEPRPEDPLEQDIGKQDIYGQAMEEYVFSEFLVRLCFLNFGIQRFLNGIIGKLVLMEFIIADQFMNDYAAYVEHAQKHTSEHAS